MAYEGLNQPFHHANAKRGEALANLRGLYNTLSELGARVSLAQRAIADVERAIEADEKNFNEQLAARDRSIEYYKQESYKAGAERTEAVEKSKEVDGLRAELAQARQRLAGLDALLKPAEEPAPLHPVVDKTRGQSYSGRPR